MNDSGGPAVVGASWYRFRPGERIHNRHVKSVCFMWTVRGTGVVRCNGEEHPVSAGTVLRMPWAHEVLYEAGAVNPFHVGTVHLIPWYLRDGDFIPRVAFRDGDPLLDAEGRTGRGVASHTAVIPANSSPGARIIELATYAVGRFVANRTEETALRALGELLLDESGAWDRLSSDPPLPAALTVMTTYVVEKLAEPLTVPDIAAAASVSIATAGRLFTRYTGKSPLAWVRERRMMNAAALLQSSGRSVAEVAHAVGFTDAFYFSRVFTETFGVPPSRYANQMVRP